MAESSKPHSFNQPQSTKAARRPQLSVITTFPLQQSKFCMNDVKASTINDEKTNTTLLASSQPTSLHAQNNARNHSWLSGVSDHLSPAMQASRDCPLIEGYGTEGNVGLGHENNTIRMRDAKGLSKRSIMKKRRGYEMKMWELSRNIRVVVNENEKRETDMEYK